MTSMDITTQLSAENIDERSNKHLTLWKTDHNGCCPWGSLSISEEVVDERVSQVPVNIVHTSFTPSLPFSGIKYLIYLSERLCPSGGFHHVHILNHLEPAAIVLSTEVP